MRSGSNCGLVFLSVFVGVALAGSHSGPRLVGGLDGLGGQPRVLAVGANEEFVLVSHGEICYRAVIPDSALEDRSRLDAPPMCSADSRHLERQ